MSLPLSYPPKESTYAAIVAADDVNLEFTSFAGTKQATEAAHSRAKRGAPGALVPMGPEGTAA
jgi:hypothetical protein